MMAPTPKRLTAMHHQHLAAGAAMVDEAGWSRPARYADPDAERARLRASVGICDISPFVKLSIQGDGLEAALLPELEGVAVGRLVRRTDGAVVARLAPDEAFLVSGPAPAPPDAALLAGDGTRIHAVDLTSGMAGAAVTGPAAGQALASLTDLDLSDGAFPDLSCAQARFVEVYGLLLRLDTDGLPGYQLYFSRDFGHYLWEALVEAAEHLDGGPVGVEAWTGPDPLKS